MDVANNYKTVGYKFKKVPRRIRDETASKRTLCCYCLWRRFCELTGNDNTIDHMCSMTTQTHIRLTMQCTTVCDSAIVELC